MSLEMIISLSMFCGVIIIFSMLYVFDVLYLGFIDSFKKLTVWGILLFIICLPLIITILIVIYMVKHILRFIFWKPFDK